jgi:hypothetical protein
VLAGQRLNVEANLDVHFSEKVGEIGAVNVDSFRPLATAACLRVIGRRVIGRRVIGRRAIGRRAIGRRAIGRRAIDRGLLGELILFGFRHCEP